MRRLAGYAALAAFAAGLLATGCGAKRGGLGTKCTLACAHASSTSFCQSSTDDCESELAVACVGTFAVGGTCSGACKRDDDCRGGAVPMVCSGACTRVPRICLRPEDAKVFCSRTTPVISCADLSLRGDGVCDGPTGSNLCADDAADCGGQEPWAATCGASCADVRTRACPLDDLSGCEALCAQMVRENVACRREAKAYLACDLGPGARACGADQKSQMTGICDAQQKALSACITAASKF